MTNLFWQVYKNLEKEFLSIAEVVHVNDKQLNVYSMKIADLLVRTAIEIESISKHLYLHNGGIKTDPKQIYFDTDAIAHLNGLWQIEDKKVLVVSPELYLEDENNTTLQPMLKASKRSGTEWNKAYQAVKHDRYSFLKKGNIKAVLHALAALYLLNIYYRKESWVVKYQDLSKQDFSLGSSLFAVKPPVKDQLWEGNKAVKSDSPFVVCYTEADYKRLDEIRQKEYDELNEYWRTQPELQEPAFQAQLLEAMKDGQRVMHIWELAKYRLHKLCTASLPFEERKKRLLHSEAWNGWVNQHNKHLAPEELTEENIESEINNVGIHWGMDIMKRYQRLEWVPIAMNSGMCRVYIPE